MRPIRALSRQTEGLCIFNVQELAEPIVETIWDNVNIGMADVDSDIMLDQVNINLDFEPDQLPNP